MRGARPVRSDGDARCEVDWTLGDGSRCCACAPTSDRVARAAAPRAGGQSCSRRDPQARRRRRSAPRSAGVGTPRVAHEHRRSPRWTRLCAAARHRRSTTGRLGPARIASPTATLRALLAAMGVDATRRRRRRGRAGSARERRRRARHRRPPLPRAGARRRAWRSTLAKTARSARRAGSCSRGREPATEVPRRSRRRRWHGGPRPGRSTLPLPTGLSPVPRPAALRRSDRRRRTLIVAPRALLHAAAAARRRAGLGPAVQLYALRSERNWGIGDFTDLRAVARAVGRSAARDLVGVNPLHALFPHNPAHASPYSPSSRLFLNPLYIDVEAHRGLREMRGARALVAAADSRPSSRSLRAAELVDYAAVAGAKSRVLAQLYAHFAAQHLEPPSTRARHGVPRLRRRGGVALERQALFEALQERLSRRRCRGVGLAGVARALSRSRHRKRSQEFAREHAEDGRLPHVPAMAGRPAARRGGAGARCRDAAWRRPLSSTSRSRSTAPAPRPGTHRRLYALRRAASARRRTSSTCAGRTGACRRCAPAPLARRRGYAPFIATLRANMRHAGRTAHRSRHGAAAAVLDPAGHAAGGRRLCAVSARRPAGDRSRWRASAIVAWSIGEDLGTGARRVARRAARMPACCRIACSISSATPTASSRCRETYPAQALVTASTHDLPTLTGWWQATTSRSRERWACFRPSRRATSNSGERATGPLAPAAARWRAGAAARGHGDDPDTCPQMTHGAGAWPCSLLARAPSQMHGGAARGRARRERAGEPARRPSTSIRTGAASYRCARGAGQRRALRRARGARCAQGAARAVAARAGAARQRDRAARDLPPAVAPRLHASPTRRRIVPYLAALGVSHVYCSPYPPGARRAARTATTSSTTTRSTPSSARAADFERFTAALRAHGMGQILDMVPNHMGVMGADNAWWMDVLENGQASRYAGYFDIDWHPVERRARRQGAAPGARRPVRRCARARRARTDVRRPTAAASRSRYHEHRFPLDPRELRAILERRARAGVDARRRSSSRAAQPRDRAFAPAAARRDADSRRRGGTPARQGAAQAPARAAGARAPARRRRDRAQPSQ